MAGSLSIREAKVVTEETGPILGPEQVGAVVARVETAGAEAAEAEATGADGVIIC
jgi:hypothetical protein